MIISTKEMKMANTFLGISKDNKLEIYLLTSAEDLYEYLAEESEGFCLIAKKDTQTN